MLLPFVNDGFSSAINITGGFRFGNMNETAVYVRLLSCFYLTITVYCVSMETL